MATAAADVQNTVGFLPDYDTIVAWLADVKHHRVPQNNVVAEHSIGYYKLLGVRIKMCKALQDALKEVLNNALGEMGVETEYACAAGKAQYREGYTRVTYDGKGLDKLCAGDADLKRKLAPYRHEEEVDGSLAVS